MSVFFTIMAAIGIVVTVILLTVILMVVRVILKVRRGLAEASVHIVTPHRRAGTDSDFASAGSITLTPDAWTSSSSDVGNACGSGNDGGSGDCGGGDGGGGGGGD